MEHNSSVIDILHDESFMVKLQNKLSLLCGRSGLREGSDNTLQREKSFVKDDEHREFQSSKQLIINRSPSTDFEVCNVVYTFLRTQYLAVTSRSSTGEALLSKKLSSLEKALKSRLSHAAKAKNLIPQQQQTELVLLWSVEGNK